MGGGLSHLSVKKDLKQRNKMVFLKLTCHSQEKFLISRYTSILDNRKQEYHCNYPLFTFRSTSQGVKYRLFSSKKTNSSRKFNDCKFALGGSEKFQKWYSTKFACLEISNVIHFKVANFIKQQPHGVSNHLLSVKSIKIEKKNVPVISNIFSRPSLLISTFKRILD